jgi:hypothetical protein
VVQCFPVWFEVVWICDGLSYSALRSLHCWAGQLCAARVFSVYCSLVSNIYLHVLFVFYMYVCIYMHVHVAGTVFSLALILWITGACWAKIVTYTFAGLRGLVALVILVECVYLDCMVHTM